MPFLRADKRPGQAPNVDTSTTLQLAGVRYDVAERTLFAGVDLAVARGTSVAIMGPSGSGKSSLLACVLGLVAPTAGTVRVAGVRVDTRDKRALVKLRREQLGVVFQFGELLPELTPVENVALAALLAGRHQQDSFDASAALLEQLGVSTTASTTQLSGGERQRVAVARALVNEPPLILADEPTGSLDAASKHSVATLLYELPRERNCAVVLVTHDHSVADRADRMLLLGDGVLTEPSLSAAP